MEAFSDRWSYVAGLRSGVANVGPVRCYPSAMRTTAVSLDDEVYDQVRAGSKALGQSVSGWLNDPAHIATRRQHAAAGVGVSKLPDKRLRPPGPSHRSSVPQRRGVVIPASPPARPARAGKCPTWEVCTDPGRVQARMGVHCG
jgi:hypothetical protein